jgi:hypothetical protein
MSRKRLSSMAGWVQESPCRGCRESPGCKEAAGVQNDGAIDISDPIALL